MCWIMKPIKHLLYKIDGAASSFSSSQYWVLSDLEENLKVLTSAMKLINFVSADLFIPFL